MCGCLQNEVKQIVRFRQLPLTLVSDYSLVLIIPGRIDVRLFFLTREILDDAKTPSAFFRRQIGWWASVP